MASKTIINPLISDILDEECKDSEIKALIQQTIHLESGNKAVKKSATVINREYDGIFTKALRKKEGKTK